MAFSYMCKMYFGYSYSCKVFVLRNIWSCALTFLFTLHFFPDAKHLALGFSPQHSLFPAKTHLTQITLPPLAPSPAASVIYRVALGPAERILAFLVLPLRYASLEPSFTSISCCKVCRVLAQRDLYKSSGIV